MQNLTTLRTLQSCQRRCISMVLSGNADKRLLTKQGQFVPSAAPALQDLLAPAADHSQKGQPHLWVASTQRQGEKRLMAGKAQKDACSQEARAYVVCMSVMLSPFNRMRPAPARIHIKAVRRNENQVLPEAVLRWALRVHCVCIPRGCPCHPHVCKTGYSKFATRNLTDGFPRLPLHGHLLRLIQHQVHVLVKTLRRQRSRIRVFVFGFLRQGSLINTFASRAPSWNLAS